jgi:lipoprotein signal peptidase
MVVIAVADVAIATGGLVVMLQLVFSFFFLEDDDGA